VVLNELDETTRSGLFKNQFLGDWLPRKVRFLVEAIRAVNLIDAGQAVFKQQCTRGASPLHQRSNDAFIVDFEPLTLCEHPASQSLLIR
jgi:hypothetical protein